MKLLKQHARFPEIGFSLDWAVPESNPIKPSTKRREGEKKVFIIKDRRNTKHILHTNQAIVKMRHSANIKKINAKAIWSKNFPSWQTPFDRLQPQGHSPIKEKWHFNDNHKCGLDKSLLTCTTRKAKFAATSLSAFWQKSAFFANNLSSNAKKKSWYLFELWINARYNNIAMETGQLLQTI